MGRRLQAGTQTTRLHIYKRITYIKQGCKQQVYIISINLTHDNRIQKTKLQHNVSQYT